MENGVPVVGEHHLCYNLHQKLLDVSNAPFTNQTASTFPLNLLEMLICQLKCILNNPFCSALSSTRKPSFPEQLCRRLSIGPKGSLLQLRRRATALIGCTQPGAGGSPPPGGFPWTESPGQVHAVTASISAELLLRAQPPAPAASSEGHEARGLLVAQLQWVPVPAPPHHHVHASPPMGALLHLLPPLASL